VIGTDGRGSCNSNYHTITTTTAPTKIKMTIFFKNYENMFPELIVILDHLNVLHCIYLFTAPYILTELYNEQYSINANLSSNHVSWSFFLILHNFIWEKYV
jgi:hypothetical protein